MAISLRAYSENMKLWKYQMFQSLKGNYVNGRVSRFRHWTRLNMRHNLRLLIALNTDPYLKSQCCGVCYSLNPPGLPQTEGDK